ncbi:MAG: hypothetical protein VYB65_09295 [Myxococcota bacterium]|nr:hypothetical protein [Myxococcota bacterium]
MNDQELSQGLMDELAAAEGGLSKLRIGGVVLVIFLIAYLQFMYSQLNAMMEPEGLADIGVMMIEDHATEVVRAVESDFVDSASHHVQEFYTALVEGVPVVRVSLMDHMRAGDSALARQMEAWLTDYFDTLVKENPQLQLAAEKKQIIAQDAFKGLGDIIRSDLEMTFEAGGVDRELGEASAMISGFADRLERYSSGIGLGSDEREERDLLYAWINLVAPDFEGLTEPIEAAAP